MERRKFTREFKVEAVKRIQERGMPVVQAGRDLGVQGRCYACAQPFPAAAVRLSLRDR